MNTTASTSTPQRPRVVIAGVGFAGLYAARVLQDKPVDVLLVDQNSYHTFQPLLYQVATSLLEPEETARTIRGIFKGRNNIDFRQATITGVDWERKRVLVRSGHSIPFDYLIVGTGTIYNDFGTPGVRENSLFLKSLSEAVNIRSHILRQFERAAADPSIIEDGALNFVIVGGGPTGVEMAGSMTELFKRVLPKDFPNLDVTRARVILLEMAGHLLGPYSPSLRDYTARVLRKHGVEVRLETAVSEVTPTGVVVGDGEFIPTGTVIWSAGVRAHPMVEALDTELTRGGRIAVERNLSLPGRPFAFAAGDVAAVVGGDEGPHPQLAQVAIQQGKHAANEILRELRGRQSQPFRYRDPGSMSIISSNAGVAELSPRFGGLKLSGFLGWLGWLFIHLIYLPGHVNRVSALFNWAYSYVTSDRHARLIAPLVPSPAEVANRTERLVDDEELHEHREAVFEEVVTQGTPAAAAAAREKQRA